MKKLLTIVLLSFLCVSCGVSLKVKGGTTHTVKIDPETIDAIRDLCENEETEEEENCVQDLIDLVKTKDFNAEELSEEL